MFLECKKSRTVGRKSDTFQEYTEIVLFAGSLLSLFEPLSKVSSCSFFIRLDVTQLY